MLSLKCERGRKTLDLLQETVQWGHSDTDPNWLCAKFFAKFEELLWGIFQIPSSQEQERWIYLSLPWRHRDAGARQKYLLWVRTECFFFQGRKGSSREVTIKYFNDEIKAVNIIKKAVNMSKWYSSYKPVGRWKPAKIFFFCIQTE